MSDFQSPVGRRQPGPLAAMRCAIETMLVILFFVLTSPAFAQSAASLAPASCPVQFLRFDPDSVSARIKNVSSKKNCRTGIQRRRCGRHGTMEVATLEF